MIVKKKVKKVKKVAKKKDISIKKIKKSFDKAAKKLAKMTTAIEDLTRKLQTIADYYLNQISL